MKTATEFKTGDWKELKSKLKKLYPKLTDNDLSFDVGKENSLVKRLQTKLGKSEEEIDQILTNIYK